MGSSTPVPFLCQLVTWFLDEQGAELTYTFPLLRLACGLVLPLGNCYSRAYNTQLDRVIRRYRCVIERTKEIHDLLIKAMHKALSEPSN